MLRIVSPNFKDLFTPNVEIGIFPDGDTHVRVMEVAKYKDEAVVLFHRLYPNQNSSLVELILLLDALKKVNARVMVTAPYLPYSRQDKAILEGEVISAQVICDLIADAGCEKLITFDCHFLKKEGEFTYGKLKVKNTSLNNELLAYMKEICQGESFETVAPDQGAAYLVSDQGGKAMQKSREMYKEEKVAYRDMGDMRYTFEVKDRNILILDDMISTGSTMIKAIECLKKGGAKKIYCAAAHGFFLNNSLEKLQSLCDGVFVSDPILSPVSKVSIINRCQEL